MDLGTKQGVEIMSTIWLALSSINGLGNKKIISLYRQFPDLNYKQLSDSNLFNSFSDIIKNNKVLSDITNPDLVESLIINTKFTIERHKKFGIEVITIGDPRYPKLLKRIDDPPISLYCLGNLKALENDKNIAIVGTRKPTELGIKAAKKVSSVFVGMGYSIVSGLAEGIDSAGHIGALTARGVTIAVLAGSLDKIYPKSNEKLAKQIIENNGLLISEVPLGAKTFRSSFVQRDRIQSGLSLGVCPVQTDITGGTQHTIKFAKEQNRILFCPNPLEPSDITATRGIYKLINDNEAEVIARPEDYKRINDILENLYIKISEISHTEPKKASQQLDIFNNLSKEKEYDKLMASLIEMSMELGIKKEQFIQQINWKYDVLYNKEENSD